MSMLSIDSPYTFVEGSPRHVFVEVGLSKDGQNPKWFTALVDTGASATCVVKSVADDLELDYLGTFEMHHGGGTEQRANWNAAVMLRDDKKPERLGAWSVQVGQIPNEGYVLAGKDVKVILGNDILLEHCIIEFNKGKKRMTLRFNGS